MLDDFVDLFVFNIEKLVVWCISAKKNFYDFTKNNHKFQASVKERCTSLSKNSGIFQENPLKSTCEKVKALKKLCYT